MLKQQPLDINSFFIAGINYKKTDAALRGRFSIDHPRYQQLVELGPKEGIQDFFIVSTCNRTEIYGFASSAKDLSRLVCSQTEGTGAEFDAISYVFRGHSALEHLFKVASGLDSQILGDYEIIGQIRQAAKFSKEHHCLSAYLERLINEVLQCAKRIRTNTALSGGTVSVSFAAVQFIRNHFDQAGGKHILLLGTGKIGTNTCKNIADYLPGNTVTVMNRTFSKAEETAALYGFDKAPIEAMEDYMQRADAVIVATNSQEAFILPSHFAQSNASLIIDLSVPCNVDPAVGQLAHIKLVNVDELSRVKDETLQKRAAEVPKALAIICEHVQAFLEWHDMRRHVPVLKEVKSKLRQIHSDVSGTQEIMIPITSLCEKAKEARIQKVINGMAVKMRYHHQPGCQYIEALNDFMATGSE